MVNDNGNAIGIGEGFRVYLLIGVLQQILLNLKRGFHELSEGLEAIELRASPLTNLFAAITVENEFDLHVFDADIV